MNLQQNGVKMSPLLTKYFFTVQNSINMSKIVQQPELKLAKSCETKK